MDVIIKKYETLLCGKCETEMKMLNIDSSSNILRLEMPPSFEYSCPEGCGQGWTPIIYPLEWGHRSNIEDE